VKFYEPISCFPVSPDIVFLQSFDTNLGVFQAIAVYGSAGCLVLADTEKRYTLNSKNNSFVAGRHVRSKGLQSFTCPQTCHRSELAPSGRNDLGLLVFTYF